MREEERSHRRDHKDQGLTASSKTLLSISQPPVKHTQNKSPLKWDGNRKKRRAEECEEEIEEEGRRCKGKVERSMPSSSVTHSPVELINFTLPEFIT